MENYVMSVRQFLASLGVKKGSNVEKLNNGNGAFIGYTLKGKKHTLAVGSGINSQDADLGELSIYFSEDETTGEPFPIACASSLTVLDSFVM
jgi:hypothetical protein